MDDRAGRHVGAQYVGVEIGLLRAKRDGETDGLVRPITPLMRSNEDEGRQTEGEEDREGGRGPEEGQKEEMTEEEVWEVVFEEGLSQDVATEEGEEDRESTALKTPQEVAKQEQEEHERTHTPYRAWCDYCVKGRGRNMPHMSKKNKESEDDEMKVPMISMDYFFMSKKDEAAKENPLLIMLNEATQETYARATGRKGTGEEGDMQWLVKDISEELKSWGHQGGGRRKTHHQVRRRVSDEGGARRCRKVSRGSSCAREPRERRKPIKWSRRRGRQDSERIY